MKNWVKGLPLMSTEMYSMPCCATRTWAAKGIASRMAHGTGFMATVQHTARRGGNFQSLQGLSEPGDHLRLPVLHLRGAPASHAMAAAFDRNHFAGGAHLPDGVAKRGRLRETHLIVSGAVYHQKRRHAAVNGGDGRNRVQLCQAGIVQLF